jgi:putative transposase
MAEYRRRSHTIYDIQYHLVWVTKYRYHVLTGEVAVRARELIRQSCMSRDLKILRGTSRRTTFTFWCRVRRR